MMRTTYLTFLISFFIVSRINAQLDAPKLILPNPEAFSFTKYGDVPIGLFTGTMNYSVPLMQLQNAKINIPITLDYATNGVKVDEVAGRTGIGWNLRAGGLITRTIIGKSDDGVGLTAPSSNDSSSTTFYNYMKLAAQNSSNTQPDEYTFSFAGYSGKFYYNYAGNVVQLTPSAIKIERANLGTVFKFTTPDGFQYFFTQTEYSDSYSAYVEVDPLYTSGQGGYTAWYLTKIISSTGDIVNLKYSGVGNASITNPIEYFSSFRETAVVYSLTYQNGQTLSSLTDYYMQAGNCTLLGQSSAGQIIAGNQIPECISGPPMTRDFNVSTIVPVKLTEINFSKGVLRFYYSSREDLPGEEKLDSLILYSIPANSKVQVVNFNYTYSESSSYNMPMGYSPGPYNNNTSFQNIYPYLKKRLFLENVRFLNINDNNDYTTYKFEYNEFNALPPRLSFAQDKFGYFNGKNNTGFIPSNTIIQQYLLDPTVGADREADSNFTAKGVLSKIVYPTGGYTDVTYENNRIVSNYRRVYDSVTKTINYNETESVVYSSPFRFDYPLKLTISAEWVTPPPPRGEFDPPPSEDTFAVVSLIDSSTNVCFVCNAIVRPGDNFVISQNFQNLSPLSAYKIKIESNNSNVKARAVFSSYTINSDPYNAAAGGVRVKQIKNFARSSGITSRKLFDYNDKSGMPGLSGISSGSLINNFQDNRDFYQLKYDNCNPNFYGGHYELSSSSAIGGFANDYLSVNYQYVTEYQDSAAINGYSVSQFKIAGNQLPTTFACAPIPNQDNVTHHSHHLIPGAPYSNTSVLNGKQIRQTVYKNLNGNYKKVKDVFTYYSIDQRLYNVDSFYVIKRKFVRDPYYANINYFGDYDINKYKKLTAWVHQDSLIEKNYDDNNTELITKTLYSYGNANHLQPTQTATIRSKGDTLYNRTKYPHDLSMTQLVNLNFLIAPVLQQSYLGPTLLSTSKVNYKIIDSIIVIDSVEKAVKNFPLETELKFTRYDKYGNPLEFATKGQISSMLFDTTVNGIAASSQNSTFNDIAYTSFETAYPGNWSLSSSSRDSLSITVSGRKSYDLASGSITKPDLTNGKSYIVSYWSKSGTRTFTGASSTFLAGRSVNGWTYYEHKLTTSATSITINGTGLIDELRLYPLNNQMTSYVYDPLIGQKSVSDANGELVYYDYDAFGRLKNIKDYQGNIIKNFQYNYAKSCGNNCVVLTMQTFTGYNTPSYPVGVFNGSKQYIGTASNPAQYVSLWNSNAANQAIGVLSTNADSLHFNLSLTANAIAPPIVFGLRFYQWDVFTPTTVSVKTDTLSFIDWGDGSSQLVTQSRTELRDINFYGYFSNPMRNDFICYNVDVNHTYSNSQPRTITLFHNETTEAIGVSSNGIASTQDASIRGHYPEKAKNLLYNNIYGSSDLGIKNFSKLTELLNVTYQLGGHHAQGHNRWQSISNAHKLKWMKIAFRYGEDLAGNLLGDFPDLLYLEVQEFKVNINQIWGAGGFKNLYVFANGLITGNSFTTAEIDLIINTQASINTIQNGKLGFGPTPIRSIASDGAYNLLISRGWQVNVDNPTSP